MFRFCSLYSGSTGNCLFVETDHAKVLIDAGVSSKKIVSALSSISINVDDIDAILVTHEHSDHVQSLGTISNKFDIPVFANAETWNAMPKQKDKILDHNVNFFHVDEDFEIGDLKVLPFCIPHDAANPCGFNLFYNDNKLSVATDLGHITSNVLNHLDGTNFLMLEANYDPEVLKCGRYPFMLKSRIAGPNGHLSNNLAGKTISHLIGSGLSNVVIGHLSKDNNFPELAYTTVLEELAVNNYCASDVNISVASPTSPSDLFSVCGKCGNNVNNFVDNSVTLSCVNKSDSMNSNFICGNIVDNSVNLVG